MAQTYRDDSMDRPMLIEEGRASQTHERLRWSLLLRSASRSDRLVLCFGLLMAAANGMIFPAISWFLNDLFTAIFLENPARDEKTRKAVLIFFGLAAAGFVTGAGVWIAFSTYADRQMVRLRRLFFDRVLAQEVAWFDKNDPASMMTRLLSDTYDFREGVGEKLAQLVGGIFSSIGGFIVAFTKSWKFTLVLSTAMPLVVVIIGLAMRRISKFAGEQQKAYAAAGGIAESALASMRTVAAFGGQRRELERYNVEIRIAQRRGVLAGVANGMSMGALLMTMYCLYSLGFWWGRVLIVDEMDNGCYMKHLVDRDFNACFNGGTMLSALFGVIGGMMGLGMLAQSFSALAMARSAAARLFAVIDREPAIKRDVGLAPAAESVAGCVELRNLRFAYPTRPEVLALDAVSLTFEPGKTSALVGASGSGKSTIVALIQRFYDPLSGSILLDGVDIKTLRPSWLRSQMALVQQEPVLFSGTIAENITYGCAGVSGEQVAEAARLANADEFIRSFPDGYNTVAGERGAQLSGGQKQRIAIARAVVRNAAILLLDEATSALDTESERVVQAALDRLLRTRRRTTVVIAHRLSTIRTADQICVFQEGKLVERGSHEDLAHQDESRYAQMLRLQKLTGEEKCTVLSRQVSNASTGSAVSADVCTTAESPNVKPRSPRSDVGVPIATQAIGPDVGCTVSAGMTDAPVPEEGHVPFGRLWKLSLCDWVPMLIGLCATIVVGSARPLLGNIFANAANLFTKDLAIHILTDGMAEAEQYVTDNANTYCLEFVGIGVALFVGYLLQVVGFRIMSESLTAQLRSKTFQAMLRQDTSWFDTHSSGALAERLATEVPLIRAFTGEQLMTTVQAVITLSVGIMLALSASWKLTLSMMLLFPLLGLGFLLVFKAKRYDTAATARNMGTVASEALGNIRTVASLGLETRLTDKLSSSLAETERYLWKANLVKALSNGVSNCMVYILFASVFGLAVIFIDHGWMAPDEVLNVFFPLMYSIAGVVSTQTWAADRLKARSAVRKVFETIDRVPDVDAESLGGDQLTEVVGTIDFVNLTFCYPTRPTVAVFKELNLHIKANSTVAFVGPSGSGKSTIVSLIERFYDPQEGTLLLDGRDVRSLQLSWYRSQLALVQQEPVLFAGTIRDNVAYGRPDASDDDIREAARQAHAETFVASLPQHLATEVGERGVQLSGGQKQRLAIARALVRRPRVLLLDEATSALDSESERLVQAALDDLLSRSRCTTLVIAHRLSTIQGVDEIFVLSSGAVIERGTHLELIAKSNGHYRQLVAQSVA
eukprot:TRINITY_DN21280_c0_g2_i1.p1 TRINITY_DN21280_c0_g2~~TRINITY_DN21280_c0_g2_i1.p1  ORF type:complete len:1312 (-),score=211.16 TRINITY_DN21280_c0_g2_i1:75-3941(-)